MVRAWVCDEAERVDAKLVFVIEELDGPPEWRMMRRFAAMLLKSGGKRSRSGRREAGGGGDA
jgi:hypothetical protein